jgi:hypothetical protein
MANAYVIAKPWIYNNPNPDEIAVGDAEDSVPEGATLEEKYNTLLADYKELKIHSEALEIQKKRVRSEMHKRFLEIQTANNQIKDQHEEITHALSAIQMFLKVGA